MVDPATSPYFGPIALTAARAGAAAIRSVIGTGQLGTQFKSGGHDMVTAADKASERAVIDAIRTARPADWILGEEGGAHQGTTDVRWLVDPLDGTANFVYGRADYAVSVGAELAAEPSAGSIIRPAGGRVMAGRHGVSAGRDTPLYPVEQISSPRSGSAASPTPLWRSASHTRFRHDVRHWPSSPHWCPGCGEFGSSDPPPAISRPSPSGNAPPSSGSDALTGDTAEGQAIVIAAGGTVRPADQQSSMKTLIAGSARVVDGLAALMNDP